MDKTQASDPSPSDAVAVSVVLPVMNEAENVGQLVDEISAALCNHDAGFEIVFTDDASTDDTVTILRERIARGDRVRIVRHQTRAGQSAAIASAIEFANNDVIVTLDGDGQNDPADIPALLQRWQHAPNNDQLMVAGWRAKRRDTWIKRISSRIANWVRSSMLGDKTPDTGCGLKVFPRQAYLRFPRFNHMHRFLPALMIRGGGRVESVAVNHRPREGGTSKYGTLDRLWVGIFDLFGVLWLRKRAINPNAMLDTPENRSKGDA